MLYTSAVRQESLLHRLALLQLWEWRVEIELLTVAAIAVGIGSNKLGKY